MTEGTRQTLIAALQEVSARRSDAPAVSWSDGTLTYKQLNDAVGALACNLADAGVGPGQRVGILFPNCPQFVIAYFAAQYLGATAVPLHCLQGPDELSYVLANAGAETLIGLNLFQQTMGAIRETVPSIKRLVVSGETSLTDVMSFEECLRPPATPVAPHPADPDDVAVLIYTSGTEGQPKGAMLSHDNLLFDARSCAEAIDVNEDDIFGTVLPLFHSFAATVCMLLPFVLGAHTVLIPKFSPLSVLETLEQTRATVFAGVPSMYAVMLQMRSERAFDLSALRLGVSGGAPMPPPVQEGFEERFGVYMIEGYGPTEASPVVTVNRTDGTRKIGTVGMPIPGVECAMMDDDMIEVPTGSEGEVCVRGRNVMLGYWRDPERTADTIVDGWLRTGDIGVVDENGYISIVDRKKDMIIVGGMNVYPREVEDVIYAIPEVAECAVIGVPSRLRGEDVVACVCLREDAQLDGAAIIEYCKARLGNYKVPRSVEFSCELPKSATGKILKRELRRALSAGASGNRDA